MLKKIIGRFFATIGFLTVFMITISVILSLYHIKPKTNVPNKTILAINLNTLTITEAPTKSGFQSLFMGHSTSLFDLTNAIDHAAKDPRVKGLSMRADLVTLGHSQVQELRDAILRFRKHGKVATFYTQTFGELTPATLHYYLATGFDQIFTQPSGFLNLTGLFAALPFAAKALEQVGVKARIGTREEYKTAMSFLTEKEMSPANAEQTQNLLKELFNDMLKGITTEREISEETVLKVMEESPLMTAEKAHKLGFIDFVCYDHVYQKTIFARLGEGTLPYPVTKYIEHLKGAETDQLKDADEIALIYGAGVIQHGTGKKSFADGLLSSEVMHQAFEHAIKNPKVKAIIFRVNCPGGSAVVSDAIAQQIQIAQDHKIPVIASLGDVAASGGYWIVAGCTKIIAQPMSITGSIGVLGGKVVFNEMLQKLDINLGTVSEGPNGSMWSYVQDYTDQQWAFLQGALDDIYKTFIQRVVDKRKLSIEHVQQIAKGRVWTGNQAKQFGLVDELGGIEKAIEIAKREANIPEGQKVRIAVYPQPQSLLEQVKGYYEDERSGGISAFQAAYNTLCNLTIFIQTYNQPNPVLASVPDKIQ